VRFLEDGTVEVGSSSDPMKVYRLQGTSCECQDFTSGKAPEGWCQHRVAAGIAKRVAQVLAQQAEDAERPTADAHDEMDLVDAMPEQEPVMQTDTLPPPPAAVPEALCSATRKGTINGHETLVTVRGMTAAEFAANLQAVRDVLEAPAQHTSTPASTPQTPAAAETPVCQWHGPMKASTKAVGTWYSPSRLGDGSYCKERFPKA